MKKLYRKGTVHPTPSVVSDHLLSFLTPAMLTLAAALSTEDREVLAYLISCSSANFSNGQRRSTQISAAGGGSNSRGGEEHPTLFNCNCFRCYMNYWVKWDSSANRQQIHEILDAFEENLSKNNMKKENNRRERRKRRTLGVGGTTHVVSEEPKRLEMSLTKEDFVFGGETTVAEESSTDTSSGGGGAGKEEDSVEEEEELEKGSVRKFVSFIGERFWGVWG